MCFYLCSIPPARSPEQNKINQNLFEDSQQELEGVVEMCALSTQCYPPSALHPRYPSFYPSREPASFARLQQVSCASPSPPRSAPDASALSSLPTPFAHNNTTTGSPRASR